MIHVRRDPCSLFPTDGRNIGWADTRRTWFARRRRCHTGAFRQSFSYVVVSREEFAPIKSIALPRSLPMHLLHMFHHFSFWTQSQKDERGGWAISVNRFELGRQAVGCHLDANAHVEPRGSDRQLPLVPKRVCLHAADGFVFNGHGFAVWPQYDVIRAHHFNYIIIEL